MRIREVEQSLALIEQILGGLPAGPIQAPIDPVPAGGRAKALALVEGFRGDVLVWVRLDGDGAVERCHLRDPSWFQWPLLEAVDRGQHRRRLPALQQIVQLLLFGARSLEACAMRKILLREPARAAR